VHARIILAPQLYYNPMIFHWILKFMYILSLDRYELHEAATMSLPWWLCFSKVGVVGSWRSEDDYTGEQHR
jgi:hypothetical protein